MNDKCWLWRGVRDRYGYGRMKIGGRPKLAHRVVYERTYGPIPDEGMEIDHRCRVRACVRPDHLRLATRKQNNENRMAQNSKTGVRGVRFHRGKYEASVKHNGQHHYVGRFDTLHDADAAATAKRLELFTHNEADR